MKRLLTFKYEDNKYVIQENAVTIFRINGNDLKFNSLEFYNNIYKDPNKSTLIELKNELNEDPLKKGNYIFDWLNEIIMNIEKEFEPDDDDLNDKIEGH